MSIAALAKVDNHRYGNLDSQTQRAIAVAAALELISKRVGIECHINQLKNEMELLSSYADQIQAAINQ